MTSEPGRAVVRRKHWLVRPENIRKLWWIFGAVLALTVAAQAFIEVHDYFGVDGLFGFSAFYGFFTCVAMVLIAKVLGWWLKRPIDYYPEETLYMWTASVEDHPVFDEVELEDEQIND